MGFEKFSITSFVLSTIAFFVAQYYGNRYMDANDFPKGMTRTLTVLIGALAVSYGVGALVDWVVG
jgi:VIT1/CCC1 family predicted Fe2+/Mn2+ transporter